MNGSTAHGYHKEWAKLAVCLEEAYYGAWPPQPWPEPAPAPEAEAGAAGSAATYKGLALTEVAPGGVAQAAGGYSDHGFLLSQQVQPAMALHNRRAAALGAPPALPCLTNQGSNPQSRLDMHLYFCVESRSCTSLVGCRD